MSFNAKLAAKITDGVFTMWAAYVFTLIALLSLPAVLSGVFPNLRHDFPSWLIGASLIALVGWISSYFLQLVLLPIIGVGQKQQTDTITSIQNMHHWELTNLHDSLRRDILKLHSHFNIKQESTIMDEVKQHVEDALTAIEELVNAVDHGPEVQLVKDKLLDIRDFLERVDTTPTVPAAPADAGQPVTETPSESAPEVPAEPVAPEAPAEPEAPAAPATTPPVVGGTSAETPAVTETPVETPEVEAPITDTNDQPVADPDAPR